MQRRSISWVALLGVGLAGVVAVTAATALGARSAASPFELVVQGRAAEDGGMLDATFTSSAPFCESGTFAGYLPHPRGGEADWAEHYTCSDGSGSLALGIVHPGSDWTIVEGSGRYAGLRGKGTYSAEHVQLEGDLDIWTGLPLPLWAFRGKFQGFVDADAVAPSLAFTSASVTKQRRTSGAYAIRVAFSLRDDVEGNTVSYRLRVKEDPWELASGSTASGSASATLLVFPSSKRARSVQLLLSGSDPVGNEVTVTRQLRLPRS